MAAALQPCSASPYAPYWLIPTPWPKPAPRIVNVPRAASAGCGAARAASARAAVNAVGNRVIGCGRGASGAPHTVARHADRKGVSELELADGLGPLRGVPRGRRGH